MRIARDRGGDPKITNSLSVSPFENLEQKIDGFQRTYQTHGNGFAATHRPHPLFLMSRWVISLCLLPEIIVSHS